MGATMRQELDRYLAGERELRDVLGLEPAYVAQLRGRAQFYLDGGHHERALIMLEMLEALDRTDPLPTLHAIAVLLELGRSRDAEEKADELLARAPGDPDALVAKAEVKLARGELVPAAELLGNVVARDPHGTTAAARRALALAARADAAFRAAG